MPTIRTVIDQYDNSYTDFYVWDVCSFGYIKDETG